MTQKISLIVFCMLACHVTTIQAREEVKEVIEQKIDMRFHATLKVQSMNGNITIKTWDDAQIKMRATKKAQAKKESDAEEILRETHIDIQPTDTGLEIRTRHPKHMRLGKGKSVSISYELTVPRQVTLDLHTTNGAIKVANSEGAIQAHTTNGQVNLRDIKGDIDAHTTNGSVATTNIVGNVRAQTTNGRIRTTASAGGVHLKTTNGAIDIKMTNLPDQNQVWAKTTNGSIDIALPANAKAELKARTSNGHISSDFPITVQGKWRSKTLQGQLNGGGSSSIELQTTNGSIEIESH